MKQFTMDMIEEWENRIESDPDWIEVKKRVQKAVDSCPKVVTYEQALAQVKKAHNI
jgi:hypothetical protein